jgi:hypothetical protein
VTALIIAIVLVSGVAGWLVQRRLRARGESDARATAEGINASDLLIPVRTFVALMLAFVLIETFSSFRDARKATTDEAGAVATEAQLASLLPSVLATDLTGSLLCYARAVAGPGWNSLERTRHTSPVVDQAEAGLTSSIGRAEQGGTNATILGKLLDADQERADARRVRLDEALPSVPGVVTILLIGSVAATVAATAALADRRVRFGLRMGLTVVTAVVLTASLLVIFDLDRPFGGAASIPPSAMQAVEQQLVASPYAASPPCNAQGVVTAAR